MLFDTHAHYDDERFDEDRDTLLASMPENNVGLILNPGCDVESSRKAVSYANKYPFVYAAVGIHPDEVGSLNEETFAQMKELFKEEKVVAVGEIGLDYYWDKEPEVQAAQREWFVRQLTLAGETDLPVIIHSRDAAEDTMRILKETGRFREHPGVIHCYSYSPEQAKEYDTYGKKRKFTTVQGIELNLSSGAYGWKTDREEEIKALTEAIQNGETVDKEPAYISKGAQKGSNDIGNSYVEIDLTNQHLYLFKDGDIVLETDFVSGNMSKADCVTPPGVFGLTYKTRNAILRGANYETPVNYWMPFNGNVGMHDATWRRAFGGTIYLTSGSHGCINLPLHMAASIYEYVSTGFPVVCYYY